MDPTRTVEATERTRDAGQTRDGRTDGRTEWNQYTPQQLRCSRGIIIQRHHHDHCCLICCYEGIPQRKTKSWPDQRNPMMNESSKCEVNAMKVLHANELKPNRWGKGKHTTVSLLEVPDTKTEGDSIGILSDRLSVLSRGSSITATRSGAELWQVQLGYSSSPKWY